MFAVLEHILQLLNKISDFMGPTMKGKVTVKAVFAKQRSAN
jgi:hypothetical protein